MKINTNLNYYEFICKRRCRQLQGCCPQQVCEIRRTRRRAEFWQYALVLFLIGLVFSILGSIFAKVPVIVLILNIINLLISLALLLPGLGVSVRRLNDVGKSWPWIFINLIPIIGSIWFIILLVKPSVPAKE